MGFKELGSFVRFVTMGALGTRRAIAVLGSHQHRPVELERYCSSNKIWMTKVKRLRLPDLICTRCGQRFEVRGKSDLEIKMSDSPNNPARQWDGGLRDTDIAIFLTIHDQGAEMTAASTINAFSIGNLRAAVAASRLGPPKSNSEGAERDRRWPSWVPPRSGEVVSISKSENGHRILVKYNDGRQYTYACNGKNVHVAAGERFVANERIVASVVSTTSSLTCPGDVWQPAIEDVDDRDCYASLKVLAADPRQCCADRLTCLMDHTDRRIGLEAAKALAARNEEVALARLESIAMDNDQQAPWAMEAVLILTELTREQAVPVLRRIATQAPHPEVRAAAVWGLGVVGCDIGDIIPIFQDADSNVVYHAVIAASRRIVSPADTAAMAALFRESAPTAAASCEALSRAATPDVECLLAAAAGATPAASWAMACLGRIQPEIVTIAPGWEQTPDRLRSMLDQLWFWRGTSPFASPGVAAELDMLNLQMFPG